MSSGLDLALFWEENELCLARPFSTDKPRCGLTLPVDDHWLLEEMQVPSTVRYFEDTEYRAQIHRECNDRCEQAFGRRPFSERIEGKGPKRIEEVVGARREVFEGGTPWLEPGVSSPQELIQHCQQIGSMSDDELLAFVLEGSEPIEPSGGIVTPWSRGPATIGTSVCGTQQLFEWIIDEPEAMGEFFDCLKVTLVRYHRLLAQARGQEVRGFAWLDDNCALFSPGLYEEFCWPVLDGVMSVFASRTDDYRFQHSDSAMSHLFPILARAGFHGVNFGPTIPAREIRAAMPTTMVHGQLAPFTLRNGSRADVEAEVRRDFEAVGGDGGLVVTTAGSIPAGTSLESIRGLVEIVDCHCRYD